MNSASVLNRDTSDAIRCIAHKQIFSDVVYLRLLSVAFCDEYVSFYGEECEDDIKFHSAGSSALCAVQMQDLSCYTS